MGPQQTGGRLRCRSLRRQRQEAFNNKREPGALDTISSLEVIEHRSAISGGLFAQQYVTINLW